MYTPLNSWQTRVLRLHPGVFDEPMRCELLVVDLIYFEGVVVRCPHGEHTITYNALSYTWGDAPASKSTTCNDEEFPVTENLLAALRHVRLADRPYYIWVDAICINQSDVAEKNMQVANMAAIYRKARRVIAWLGMEGEFTSLVLDGISAEAPEANIPFTTPDVYEGLVDLYERPWFRRIWVQQEIFFARELVILCGKRVIECQTLLTYPDKLWKEVPPGDWYKKLSLLSSIHETNLKAFLNWLSPARLSLHDRSDQVIIKEYPELVDTLLETNQLGATDPRDHVFAVLGLTNTPSRRGNAHDSTVVGDISVPINYSSTLAEVYRSLTMYVVKRDQNLSVIEFYTGAVWGHHSHSRDFPSWVVDWRRVYKQRTPLFAPPGHRQPTYSDDSDDSKDDFPDWRRTLKWQEWYDRFRFMPKEISKRQGKIQAEWFAQFCEDNRAADSKLRLRGVIEKTIMIEDGRVFCPYKPGRCFRPKSVRDDDIVVTFLVAERPCVLRPTSTSEYEIVDFLRECDVIEEPVTNIHIAGYVGMTNYYTIFPRHRKELLRDVRGEFFFSDIMEFIII